jgi:hypothetical protein
MYAKKIGPGIATVSALKTGEKGMKRRIRNIRHDVLTIITMTKKSNPIKKEEEVQQNPDPHIDQDFPGFPHLPADNKSINPKTATEKKSAGTNGKKSKKTYG